ncbi:hypothetical protein ABZ313_35780 [Streptomyces sp. NPDC006251]|uniref:hypothetical protein n=1 Tax=Streptomyces sp. NPDC006251 TaxID=3155718 RepID=UPI0033AEFFC9
MPSEADARVWYEFVCERLADELGGRYPTADSEPAVGVYRAGLGEAQAAQQGFVEAVYRNDQGAAQIAWRELRVIADRWSSHPDFPGPDHLPVREGGVDGE